MVIQERKLVTIQEAKRIIREGKDKDDMLNKLDTLPRRQPKPPAPEGGISLSEASRKHGIPHQTFSRWVRRGLIPVVSRTNKELYIEEDKVKMIVDIYKRNPGQGTRILMQLPKCAD